MIAFLPPRSSSMGPRAHDDPAAACAIRVANARAADDDGTGREVRSLDVLSRSSTLAVGLSMSATTASIVSARLCGGMFVAMPTAIPSTR